MFGITLLILASVGIALGLAYVWPEKTKYWFMRFLRLRRVAGAIFSFLVGTVLLMTGNLWFMLLGGIIFVFLTLTLLFTDYVSP